jgi:hypothetical protein
MKTVEDILDINFDYSSTECNGQEQCKTCLLSAQHNGYCSGCNDEYRKRCLKLTCRLVCGTCSGGKHAHTPGLCGRAPELWKNPWNAILSYEMPDYTPKPIHLDCRLIPVIYAQIRHLRIPEQFPKIEAWAAPIHKVADRKLKFRSNDLKDYLGLPPDRKLILITNAPDDYQEILWEKGPKIDYTHYGIDYWFPAHFSIYDNDSKLYQFASAKRQQIHALLTQSQFVWFRLGENIPVKFLSPIRRAPSVLISTANMKTRQNRAIFQNEVRIADDWFQDDTAFFVTGGLKELSVKSRRICYEINSKWIVRGVRGYNLANKKDMRFMREEVLKNNLKESYDSLN